MRILVAEAAPDGALHRVHSRRVPVRLGTTAFPRGRLDRPTLDRAVAALGEFRRILDRRGVTRYRAVATSATRNARNGLVLVDRARREAGLELEVIDGDEEARLVRTAVLGASNGHALPRIIADLGGGSLEVSVLSDREPDSAVVVHAGTVRLLHAMGGPGPLDAARRESLQARVRRLLGAAFPEPPTVGRGRVVACGGNAETLARLAPPPEGREGRALDLRRLAHLSPRINGMDVADRVEEFGVRRERAEVMGVAAVVLVELGHHLGFRRMDVPGVGLREGIVRDLAHVHFGPEAIDPEAARALTSAVRALGRRHRHDREHADRVRFAAALLFDRLAGLHRLPVTARLTLELAALLHDVGKAVAREGHARHGEYLVRHAEIPGLEPERRAALSRIVRCHNSVDPDPESDADLALGEPAWDEIRALTALLRVADGLDRGATRAVEDLAVRVSPRSVAVDVHAAGDVSAAVEGARRRATLFGRVFRRRLTVRAADA